MVINLKKQRKTRKHHENQIHQENHKTYRTSDLWKILMHHLLHSRQELKMVDNMQSELFTNPDFLSSAKMSNPLMVFFNALK